MVVLELVGHGAWLIDVTLWLLLKGIGILGRLIARADVLVALFKFLGSLSISACFVSFLFRILFFLKFSGFLFSVFLLNLVDNETLGLVISLLLILPVLDVLQNLHGVDVGHIVVLGQLVREVRLASAWLSTQSDLEWLKAAHLAELVLHELNVAGETGFAVPVEIALTRLLTFSGLFSHEQARGLCLDIHEQELTPVEVQLERGLVWVHLGELVGNVGLLNQTSANTVRDSGDQFLLAWFVCSVNTENVLTLGLGLIDLLDHPGEIGYVDSGHKIVTLADDGETCRLLEPCLLEVTVEDGLTLSVQ